MMRRPNFITYFGTPAPYAFTPFAFWVMPAMLPRVVADYVRAHQAVWVCA